MQIKLHKNARTTPAVRREIQSSSLSASRLAAKLGIGKATAQKWKKRDSVEDLSHTPHRFNKNMSDLEEFVVIELRKSLLLPLDDLLAIVRQFINPNVSRSGLDRCLRRHGVANLKALLPVEEGEPKPKKTYKDYEPGFVHVDVKYLPKMADEASRRYLFVAIDRASRWVYLAIMPDKSAQSAASFLKRVTKAAPFRISKVLTDNGKEFTDRFDVHGERQPTGNHVFDLACKKHTIEHRLTKPRHPQTNGMVERFNGRIEELLNQTRFANAKELATTIDHYAKLYNSRIPQKMLGHRAPLDALRSWRKNRPELFVKNVYNLAGPDR
jgi:transposase InsO family protein